MSADGSFTQFTPPKIAAPLATFLSIVATALAIVGTATRHWYDWSDDFHRGLWSLGKWNDAVNNGPGGTWSCPDTASTMECNALRVVQAFCILLLVFCFLDILLSAVLTLLPDGADAQKGKYGVYVKGRYSPKSIIKVVAIVLCMCAGGVGAGATGIWIVYWNENMLPFSGTGSIHNQTTFSNVRSNGGNTALTFTTPSGAVQPSNVIGLVHTGQYPLYRTTTEYNGVQGGSAYSSYLSGTGAATVSTTTENIAPLNVQSAGYTNAYSFILVTCAWVIQFAAVPLALYLDGSESFDEDVAPIATFYSSIALTLAVVAATTNYWRDDGMGQHNGLWMTHGDDTIAAGKWIQGLWTCRLTDLDACDAYQWTQVFVLLLIGFSLLAAIFNAIIFFFKKTFPLQVTGLIFTSLAWVFGLTTMCVWIIYNGYGFGAGFGYNNAAGGGNNGQDFYHGPNGYSFALCVSAWVIMFAIAPLQLWAIRNQMHEMIVSMAQRQAAPIAFGVSLGALVLSLTAATTKHWYEDGVTHKGLWGYGRWARGAWNCYVPSQNNHINTTGMYPSQLSGIQTPVWPQVPVANCDNIRTVQAFVIWEIIFCFATVVLAFLMAVISPEAKAKKIVKNIAIGSALLAAACGMTCTAEAVHDLTPTWKFSGYSFKLMVVAWVAVIAVVPAALHADGAASFGDVVPELSAWYTFLALVLAVVAVTTRYWYDEGVPGGNYFGLWNVGRWDKNGIWYANLGKIHVKNLQTTQIFSLLLIAFLFLALLSTVALTINRNLVRLQVVTFSALTLAWTCGLVAFSVFLGEITPTSSPLVTQIINVFNTNGTKNTGYSFALMTAAWVIAFVTAPVVLYWSEWAAVNHWAAPYAMYTSLSATVLSVLAAATTYWFVTPDLNTHAGLWNVGETGWGARGGVSASQWTCGTANPFVFSDASVNAQQPGGAMRTIYKPFSCDSLKTVQLFSLMLIGFSFITFIITSFVVFTSRKRALPKVLAIMAAVLGGVFGLIAMCVFLGEINRNSWHGFQRQVPVGHSFALSVAAWVILLGTVPALLYFENSFFLGCKLEPEEAAQSLYNNWAELWAQLFTLGTLVLSIIGTATRHWYDDGVSHLGLWSLGHFEKRDYGFTSSGTWKCTAGRNAYHYGPNNMCNPLRTVQAFSIGMIGFGFVAFVLAVLLSFEATPQRKKITKERGIFCSLMAGICGMIAMAVYLDDFNPFTVDVFDQNFRNHGYSFNLIVTAWVVAIAGSPVAFAMSATRDFGEIVAPLSTFYSLIAVVLSVVACGTNYWWDAGYLGGHYGLWTVGKWITSQDWINPAVATDGVSTFSRTAGLFQTKWVCNLPAYYTDRVGQTYGKCAADEIAKTFTSLQTVKTFTILLIIFAGFSFLMNLFMTVYGRESQMQYWSFFSAVLSSVSGMIAMAVWLGDIDSWKIGYSLGLEIAAWVIMTWVSIVLVYTQASPQWLAAPFATFFALVATVLAFVGTATNYWMKFGSGTMMNTVTVATLKGIDVFQGVFSSSTGWTNGLKLGVAANGLGDKGSNKFANGIGGNNAAYYLGLWSWGTWGSNGVWTCIALPGSSAHAVRGFSAACDSIKAVQVFCILLIFMAFLTLIFSAITAFFKGVTNFYGVLSPRYAGITTAVLGGLFGMIAMSIWLGEVNYTPVSQQFGATSQGSWSTNMNNQAYGYGQNGPAVVKDMSVNTNILSGVTGVGSYGRPILGAAQPVLAADVGQTNTLFSGPLSTLDPVTSARAFTQQTIGTAAGQTTATWASNQNQLSGAGYSYNAVNSGTTLSGTYPNGNWYSNGNAIPPGTVLTAGGVPTTANSGTYPNLLATNNGVLGSLYTSYGSLNGAASSTQRLLGNSVSFALVVTAWVILVTACPILLFLEEQTLWVPTISKSVV